MMEIIKNKEEVKSVMNIIQAFANGKTIQAIDPYEDEWIDQAGLNFKALFEGQYRIKPEPKYRSFANAEECWKEMQKHQPFGWVKTIHDEDPEVFIHCEVITKIDGVLTSIDEVPFSYDNMYRTYTFADGTPFGILEEEWLWHG